jgi:hypothetical protein
LTVGPGMIDFGEAMLDAVVAASHGEHVRHVIGDGASSPPLGDRVWVDPVVLGQVPQARLTSCITRRTAAVVVALT